MNLGSDVSDRAATLQEAIDALVQTFDHPQTLELTYEHEGSKKRTILKITHCEETAAYELRFDAGSDDNEPEIIPVPE